MDVAFTKAFARRPVVVGTIGASVGDGGVLRSDALTATSGVSLETRNSGNGQDAGQSHALCLGWDSTDVGAYGGRFQKQQPVKGTFDKPRIIAGQVDASAGSAALGGTQYTVTDNGTGDFTVTFARGFARSPVVVATCVTETHKSTCRIDSVDKNSFTISTFDATPAAADVDFNFIAYGSDSADEMITDAGETILVPWRKPRLLAFATLDSGSLSLEIGSDLATITNPSAGVYTITYNEAFAQQPIVVATGEVTSVPFITVSSSTVSELQLEASEPGGSKNDVGRINILVFGSDSPDVF